MKINRVKCPDGVSPDRLMFCCPGCDDVHSLNVTWSYNDDADRPTISPSILVTSRTGPRCHSFIRDGRIEFLDDCTHALKGQTVDLPDWRSSAADAPSDEAGPDGR